MERSRTQGSRREAATMGTREVNGTHLYHDVRGSGPAVLFIAGATGDGGHFARVADVLADEFTVITYDRRGNSRSPRPNGWATTSTDEQADDAAGLLEALGLVPAAAFGNSGGAIIALNLLLRHPQVVRGAILHEPPLLSVLAHPEEVMAVIQPIIARGMAAGGPSGAVEAFLRSVAGVDLDGLEPAVRERMLGNGETLFGVEFGTFEDYHPDAASLAAVRCPVQVMVGTDSAPFFRETVQWLASRLNVDPCVLPGGHAPQFDRPLAMAEAVRPFLRRVSALSTCDIVEG